MNKPEMIIDMIYTLLSAYHDGKLGGEKMPEDENPALDKGSNENYIYFTLPMALNYQRNVQFTDRKNITVAPDTHIIQASVKLGIITADEAEQSNVQTVVARRWSEILKGTDLVPIDVHTPMWLWSRGKFKVEVGEK